MNPYSAVNYKIESWQDSFGYTYMEQLNQI